jgi:hypothetical protein
MSSQLSSLPNGHLTHEEFENWIICYRVTTAFAAEFIGNHRETCIKCSNEIPLDSLRYRSTFVARAVLSSCRHLRLGSLCSKCEMDIVFRITRGEEKCFNEGCDAILQVDESAVKLSLATFPLLLSQYPFLPSH